MPLRYAESWVPRGSRTSLPGDRRLNSREVWGRFETFYAFISLFAFWVSIFSTTATKPTHTHMSTFALHEAGKTLLAIVSVSPHSCWKTPDGKPCSRQACPWPSAGPQGASAHLQSQWGPIQPCSGGSAAGHAWHCPYVNTSYSVLSWLLFLNISENETSSSDEWLTVAGHIITSSKFFSLRPPKQRFDNDILYTCRDSSRLKASGTAWEQVGSHLQFETWQQFKDTQQ